MCFSRVSEEISKWLRFKNLQSKVRHLDMSSSISHHILPRLKYLMFYFLLFDNSWVVYHFVLSCRLWTPLSYSFEQFIQVAVLVKFPGKQKVFSTQLVLLIAPLKPLSAFIRNYSLRSLYHWIISILKMRIPKLQRNILSQKTTARPT